MPARAEPAVAQIPGKSSCEKRPGNIEELVWKTEGKHHWCNKQVPGHTDPWRSCILLSPRKLFLFPSRIRVAFSNFPFLSGLSWGVRLRKARLVPHRFVASVALISAKPVRHPTYKIRWWTTLGNDAGEAGSAAPPPRPLTHFAVRQRLPHCPHIAARAFGLCSGVWNAAFGVAFGLRLGALQAVLLMFDLNCK